VRHERDLSAQQPLLRRAAAHQRRRGRHGRDLRRAPRHSGDGALRALGRQRTIAGERIDAVAAEAFGDPEQYWRICDATAMPSPPTRPRRPPPAGHPLPLEIADDGNA